MLTFQIEPVAQVWNSLMPLAVAHSASTKSYRRHEAFNPSFDRYNACNQSGFYQLFTARDGPVLAGYFGLYITASMYSQIRIATEDTFYLAPAYRGGRNALRFLKFIEAQCQAWGVHEILFSCEIDNETGIQGLLKRLDFVPVIVQFSKYLSPHTGADSSATPAESSHAAPTI